MNAGRIAVAALIVLYLTLALCRHVGLCLIAAFDRGLKSPINRGPSR